MVDQPRLPLRAIIESLQLQAGPEVVQVSLLALQIQKYRVGKWDLTAQQGEVSRSSLLHACCLVQPLVLSLLEQAGLDRRSWEQQLEIQEARLELPTAAIDQQPEIFVNQDFMSSALEQYAYEFRYREVDALGLTWAILSQPLRGASVGKRIMRAGLDLDLANNLLAEEIAARIGLAPLTGLKRYQITPAVSAALAKAKYLAGERGPRIPLTASMLLLGLIDAGAESPANSATAFLQNRFVSSNPDQYTSTVNKYLDWYGIRTSPEGEVRWMTRRVGEIFESARNLSVATRRRTLITARSLLGAILGYRTPTDRAPLGAHFLLEQLGSSAEKMTRDIFEYLQKNAPPEGGDNLEAWDDFFRSSDDRENEPGHVARVDAEGLKGRDLLRVDGDVKAFALLLASTNLAPPLAIGLFGNWGAGKSFFMRKLFERVEHLAQEAERERNKNRPTPFHGQIVQIEFNAWHYAETSLWASLVTHIFESLHLHFAPREDEEKKRWEELLKKLTEASLGQADAQIILDQAEKDLKQAQEAHDQKKLKLGNAVNAAWSVVKASLDNREQTALAETLGLSNIDVLKEDLLLRRKEAVELRERAVLFRHSFLRMLGKPSSWWGPAIVFAMVVVGLIYLSRFGANVQRTGTLVAEVVTLVLGISTWLGSAFRKASAVLGTLEKFEAQIREQTENTTTARELRKAEDEVSQARQKLEERQVQLEALRAEVEVLRPTQRLLHFLEDRSGSSDYRKHLGLPALVRRDFQQLQKLLNQEILLARDEAEKDLDRGAVPEILQKQIQSIDLPLATSARAIILEPGWRWEVEDEARRVEIERPTPDADKLRCRVFWKNLPRIDRIILYIDDLDRCPPPRVVEVLQAIHLLLAFPLFVVVVGVDARWVKRSLNVRYEDLWRSPDMDGATPQDYIEKIFQIPFWLEPLSSSSTRRYLEGLLTANPAPRRRSIAQQAGPSSVSETSGTELHPNSSGEQPAKDQAAPTTDYLVASSLISSPIPLAAGRNSEPESEPLPDLLEIEPLEHDFILRLACLVGRSPRSVKRFLNIYRLYRASRARGRLNAFLGTEDAPGPFRESLLLLSLLTAEPEIAPQIFSYLRDKAAGSTLEEVLEAINEPPPFTSRTWTLTQKALRDLTKSLAEDQAPPLRLDALRAQLRDTARYSFLEMPPL